MKNKIEKPTKDDSMRDDDSIEQYTDFMLNKFYRNVEKYVFSKGETLNHKWVEMYFEDNNRQNILNLRNLLKDDIETTINSNWEEYSKRIKKYMNKGEKFFPFNVPIDEICCGKSMREQIEDKLKMIISDELRKKRYDNMNLSDYQNLTFYGCFQFGLSDNNMEVIDKVLNHVISEYKFKKIYQKVEEEYYQSIKKSQKILGKQIELDDDRKRFQFCERNHRNFLTQMMMMELMSEFGKSEVK